MELFGPRKIGTKITIGVSAILVLILLVAAIIHIRHEYAFFKNEIRRDAERTLTVLEAVHTQTMLWRGDMRDGNPVVQTLNGTFDQLTVTSKTVTLWLVMGTKVLAHQQKRNSIEYEPPKDDVDREAITTGRPVGRIIDGNVYRLTWPVVLGRGFAENEKCFECHSKIMGITDGEVIGAFSIALSFAANHEQFITNVQGTILSAVVAFLGIAGVCTFLVKRVASDPISNMTRVMNRLAQGDVTVEVPDQGRGDEIGDMARSVAVFKRHAQAVRQHQAELAKVSRRATMGELASALAHELAQPLATINTYCRGALRRIRSGKWTKDDLVDVLQRASEMTQRASEITRGIATHVRGEEPKRAPVAVDDIVCGIKPMLEADARDNDVQLSLDLNNGARPISVNGTEIANVILNLARNSIDAMQDIEPDERKLTIQTMVTKDDGALVSVRDSGPGMSPEIREKAFVPFYSTKPDGMGIGLAICRSTIEAHGGRLWLASNSAGGTTVSFILPADGGENVDNA